MSNTISNELLIPVPFTKVIISDKFWSPRLAVNRDVTLRIQYEQLKSTGRIEALLLQWKKGDKNEPHIFWESDIAKWLEAASYSLSSHPDGGLEQRVNDVIKLLVGAQQPDGYLNVHFTVVEPGQRWSNLRDEHELYCAGHLMEAAVAHKVATGSDSLIDIMVRFAAYISEVFGTGTDQLDGYCGHEEIELALVKMYNLTSDSRYLDLARYFVNQRGTQPHYFDIEARKRGEDPAKYWAKSYAYCQAESPVRELSRVAGHSVRAMYLYSAMADLALIDNDIELKSACERLWRHLVDSNMYITGGIGPSRHNEGFTSDYDLPNETAYAETCASIGLVFWASRMLHIENDSLYADTLERALFNGVLSGVSLDGAKFLYENPLATDGSFHRQDWFDCACCPPNLARLLASLGGYIYSQSESAIAVHLYVQGSVTLRLGATVLTLMQVTNYPWEGEIKMTLGLSTSTLIDLRLRIPGWCTEHSITVNGLPVDVQYERGYAVIRREWRDGETVELALSMPVDLIQAHPKVLADTGRVAVQRGPVVYCFEDVDNGVDITNVAVSRNAEAVVVFEPDLLGGVMTIECDGVVLSVDEWGNSLYRPIEADPTEIRLRAVPYSTWDNRAPGKMAVWLPVQ